ncbi:plasmid replication protein, CyRepA1 family [Bradyrhizobium diazoefficiens]
MTANNPIPIYSEAYKEVAGPDRDDARPTHAPAAPCRLRLSVNPDLINKNEANDKSLFKSGWQNKQLTPHELAEAINAGTAYCCELSGNRRRENFVASSVLSVDVDGTVPLDEMLKHPLVERCLTIIYTTVRHTETVNRYRLIFALSRPIESPLEMVAASRSLTLRLGGDASATDAARIFYGSRGSNPLVFDRMIDDALLTQLIAQGLDADQRDSVGATDSGYSPTVSRLRIPPDQVVRLASGEPVSFSTVAPKTPICCPFHADTNASAFTVQSSRNNAVGIRCSTCRQTFWPGEADNTYDFRDFDKQIVGARNFFEANQDMGAIHDLLFDQTCPRRKGLTAAHITATQDTFLRLPLTLPTGLLFVKSPKGTGKTEELRRTLREDAGSVLLIGHRVALIRQTCQRLSLDCYLDFEGTIASERVGICLDSLRRLRAQGGRSRKFQTIIIDESQQVLSHFLSDTITAAEREQIFVDFTNLLKRAKRVIALDADLDWLTFETISKLASAEAGQAKECHVYVNDQPTGSEIQVYKSRHHLWGELMKCLAEGKRVFVTSNSKAEIDRLHESIRHEFGDDFACLAITSDTKDAPEAKAFVLDPGRLALQYRGILTSPTVGTGVDITFPEKRSEIDVVFGFFVAKINTHYDCDQQLARVRHPGSVKVWLNPSTFNFDTSREVIKHDIQVRGLYKNVLQGYDDAGVPSYHTDDPLIDMAALAVSQQRASKNNLLGNFVDLKRLQGAQVNFVAEDESGLAERGKEADLIGRELSLAKRIERLLGAKVLTRDEHDEIEARIQANEEVAEVERWRLGRTQIERFYREHISADLVKADDRGSLRAKVSAFEAVTEYAKTKEARTKMGIKDEKTLGLGTRFLRDRRLTGRLLDAVLSTSPVYKDGSFDVFRRFSMHDLAMFTKKCGELKPTIETAFELEISRDTEKAVKQLNAFLNLIGLRAIADGKSKKAGKTTYMYRLDSDSLGIVEKIVARRKDVEGWTWISRQSSATLE